MSKPKPKPKPRTRSSSSSTKPKRGAIESTSNSRNTRADSPSIVDDRTWTTGDFTLVSWDGVRFRVDVVHLLSASSAFRAAYDPDVRTIRFTDPCETASVVKSFLDFSVKFRISQLAAEHRRARTARVPSPWVALANFLSKHGCSTELRRVMYVFPREVEASSESTAEHFLIAAVAGDVGACSDIIEHAVGDALVPALLSKPIRWLMPEAYWTALCKGWERSGKHRNRAEWAHHFELLMDGAGR